MRHLVNDRRRATVVFDDVGHHEFRIASWRSAFEGDVDCPALGRFRRNRIVGFQAA